MKRMLSLLVAPLCGAVVGLAALSNGQACSDIILDSARTLGNQVVSARTLDFPGMDNYYAQLVKVPRLVTWTSKDSYLRRGRTWVNQYGFVGQDMLSQVTLAIFQHRVYNDGMNEMGLSAALLWMETAEYPIRTDRDEQGLAYSDLVPWILGQYQSIDEVKAALVANEAHINGLYLTTESLIKIPMHLVVHDRYGASLIAEWFVDKGKTTPTMHIRDGGLVDDVGVMTNEPSYLDQVAVLNSDAYKSVSNAASPAGAGNGALFGILGDFNSTSRFVRLAKIRQFQDEWRSEDPTVVGAVAQALHAINNVDLGHGVDYDPVPGAETMGLYQETGVTLVRDHTNRVLYFKGLHNQSLRKIDLARIDFNPLAGASIDGASIPADIDPRTGRSGRYEQAVDVTAQLAAPNYQYGVAGTLSLDLTVAVAQADRGKAGKYYIYAFDTNNNFWNWTGAKYGWKQVPRASMLPCASGLLASTRFNGVFVGASVAQWKGLRVFAGYGNSPVEMLLGGTVQQVFTVEENPRFQ